jgi:hypothetical protein
VCENDRCVEAGSSTDAQLDPDAPVDTTVIPPCENFASQFDVCATPPSGALVLSGFHTYSTDSHELRDADDVVIPTTSIVVTGMAGPIEVLVVESFELTTGSLRVTGDVPFGIASYGSIVIAGAINANGDGGAGRRGIALCPDGIGRNGVTDGDGSSGAGGGGFRGKGGAGGEGDENQVPVAPGQGGDATTLPLGPLGGCRGGAGGGGATLGGPPGQAGGAVYLVAQTSIEITGVIDAGGGGGGPGIAPEGGAGGGGSGGMIVLEALTVKVSGVLAANGGGGGGGADDIVPNNGAGGENGRRDTARAAGGLGALTSEGGDGGAGGAGDNADGLTSTEAADNGGGGGGGGVGFIAIGAVTLDLADGLITPPRSDWPTPP